MKGKMGEVREVREVRVVREVGGGWGEADRVQSNLL